MWTVIYLAPDQSTAERIREKMESEGFWVRIRPSHYVADQFEVLVPSGELEEAQEVLRSIL
jgi:hypothetical protein